MTANRGKVLITCRQMQVELPAHLHRLEVAGYEVLSPPIDGQQLEEDALIGHLEGVVGVIAGDDPFSRRVLEAASDLKVLVRWGIGTDSVDAVAVDELGILFTNTPGVFGEEVADSALTYMLLLARRHHRIDAAVRAGDWPRYEGVSLSGETLGIIGFGSIGRAIAARGLGFGMRVLAYDPFVDPGSDASGAEVVDLPELLQQSRFVVLAAPLTDDTRHIINAAALESMRPEAFVVNVGRGPLVDESALIQALEQDQIAGAGLDVFEVEPLPGDSPLRQFDNVVLGAHNGSNTRQGVQRASLIAVDRLLELLAEAT